MDRIAKRFRVITPQEFEKNLSAINLVTRTDTTSRVGTDSWCGNNAGANGTNTNTANAQSTEMVNNDTVMDVLN